MNDLKVKWKEIADLRTLAPILTEARTDATRVTSTSSMHTTGRLVYITNGNSYVVTTDDGTTVELDAEGNCITVNGYMITTETIKNAIKKIQEEEEYDKIPPRT